MITLYQVAPLMLCILLGVLVGYFVRRIEFWKKPVITEKTCCDLCNEGKGDPDYVLCQYHMDLMRFPDTYSTKGKYPFYPDEEKMALLQHNGETFIGGYDPKNAPKGHSGWFTGEEYFEPDEIGPDDEVIWCELPDLQELYLANLPKKGKGLRSGFFGCSVGKNQTEAADTSSKSAVNAREKA